MEYQLFLYDKEIGFFNKKQETLLLFSCKRNRQTKRENVQLNFAIIYHVKVIQKT